MSDYNSRAKVQTYGNGHSILKEFEPTYWKLKNIPDILFIGSLGYKKVKSSSRNSTTLYDEKNNFFQINLKSGKWIQKLKVVPNKEKLENVRKCIEDVLD